MIIQSFIMLGAMCAHLSEKKIAPQTITPPAAAGQVITGVRTTAYTHTESDHVEYGTSSAAGTELKHDNVRSAAADWSRYPVGTVFQIQGDPATYVVDDYGSALVGTGTIDIYQPTRASMNRYGTRRVSIKILKWGSKAKSLSILKPRAGKAAHVRQMITQLQAA